MLVAIFSPATQTAEDVLQMKGKEVNPQNLATEVQEAAQVKVKVKKASDTSVWDIFVGIISLCLSTLLTIGFIVALCFFVAFLVAHELMAGEWWDVHDAEELQSITLPVVLCGILLLASIGILLYCSIHAAVSSFGKTKPMSG